MTAPHGTICHILSKKFGNKEIVHLDISDTRSFFSPKGRIATQILQYICILVSLLDYRMSWYKRSYSSSASIKTAATVFTSSHPRYLGTWTFPDRNDPATLVDIDSIVDFTEPLDFHKTRRGATKKYDQLQKAIERGEKLPPIVVRQIDHGYQLLDGHHRYVATRRAGQSKILASIVEKSNIIDVSHIVEQIKNLDDRDIEKHFEKMYRNHLF